MHGKLDFDKDYYRRFFDRYSSKEFEMYRRWAVGWIRFLDRYVNLTDSKEKNVLELGASGGYFSRVFKDRGFNVWASDISSYIVKKSKKIHEDLNFSIIDIEKGIGLKENFDLIFAFEVFEHLSNPDIAIKNIKKKLKKGGILIFSTPFPTKRSLADPTHINVHNENWWKKIGKTEKFTEIKVIHATFVPFLYRISSIFSHGFPIKTNIPFVNSTVFFIFKK